MPQKPKKKTRHWGQVSVNALAVFVTLVLLALSITWSVIM